MTTSGTFSFNPALGEIGLYAFNLAGIRSTALTQAHMETLKMAANMVQSRWSAQGVNLWAVDLQTITLVPGTASYSIPSNTIVILDAYVTVNSGSSTTNRYILPIGRTEYVSYPNPQQVGAITVYWFDRLLSGTINLYDVPDGSQASLSYYRVRQIEDASLPGGAQVEVPFYFLEAYALALAHRLAIIWNPIPAVAAGLKALADEAYDIAAAQNIETANTYVSPIVASYWRP